MRDVNSRGVRRFGPYELLQPIGRGGMAEVWMGRRRAMGGVSKAVAVKLPTGQVADDPRLRAMFVREAELSMLLSHSTVVQVFDAGEEDGRPYLVMEWVDGMNLAQLRATLAETGRALSLPVASFVIGEVLRGLAYAHTVTHEGAPLGVVHRDVSPQNVLVSVSGEVKLTDFGVARVAREDTSGLHVKGKLRYMAPEQLAGESHAPTVDLYAVGAMLHEFIDGRRFRPSRDEVHLYGMVLSGEVPGLERSDVPRELDELRLGLLQRDPAARVQSAEQALELLMRWPGYANCSMELGRLCRSVMGVEAPRSGIHGAVVDPGPSPRGVSSASWEVDESAPTVSASASAAPTVTMGRPGAGGSGAELRAPATLAGADAARRDRLGVGLAVATGGVLLAGLGLALGTRLGAGGLADPAPVAVASLPASEAALVVADPTGGSSASGAAPGAERGLPRDAGEAEGGGAPVRRGDALSDPQAEASPGPDTPPGAGPVPSAEPVAEPEPEPEVEGGGAKGSLARTAKPRATPPRVEVTFKASEFDFLYVKVGRRVLTLEPNASTKLTVGRHPVYLRSDPDADWVRAGTLNLEAGRGYDVRMRRPRSFVVEPRP